MAALCVSPASALQDAATQTSPAVLGTVPDPPTPEAIAALLDDPSAATADRERAAGALVERAGDPVALGALVDLLTREADPAGARRLALAAIARAPTVPVELGAPLSALAASSGPEQLPGVFAALASVRTREAARAIVAFTEHPHPASVRAAAFDSLERLTARTDVPRTADAWQAWIVRVEGLTDRAWQRELIEALARRAAQLGASNERAKARIVETSRRLYLLLPGEERLAMLASLLREDRDELRRLGFELAARELSATNQLGGEVAAAALALFEHASPDVRAEAALLVSRLAPPEAEPFVARALARETDPRAAEALLLAATRWPSPVVRGPTLAWLERDAGARAAAADAALSLHRAGLLDDPTDCERVAGALRTHPVEGMNTASVRLLGALGDDDDRRALGSLFDSPRASVRLATAESLAPWPEFLEAIVARAADDASLFDAAARALELHRPAPEAFSRISRLPAPTPAAHAAVLDAFVDALRPSDRVAVAKVMRSLARREQALAPLLGEGGASLPPALLAEGMAMLAETRLALGRPEGALLAADSAPAEGNAPAADRLVRTRLGAFLALRRFDEAGRIDAPPDAWLDALERTAALPHAKETAEAVEQLLAGRLDESQLARLAAFKQAAATTHQAEDTTDEEPD